MIPIDGSLIPERYIRLETPRPEAAGPASSPQYTSRTLVIDLPEDAQIIHARLVGGGGSGSGGGTIPDGSNRYRNGNGGGGAACNVVVAPVLFTGRRLLLFAGGGGPGTNYIVIGMAGSTSMLMSWHPGAQKWLLLSQANGGGGGGEPDDAFQPQAGPGGPVPDPVTYGEVSYFLPGVEMAGQAGQQSVYSGVTARSWSPAPGKGGTAAGPYNSTTGTYAASAGYLGSGVFQSRNGAGAGLNGIPGTDAIGPSQGNWSSWVPPIPQSGLGGIETAGGASPNSGWGGIGCGGGGGEIVSGAGGSGLVELWWF